MQIVSAVLRIIIGQERKREIMYTLCAQFNLQRTNGIALTLNTSHTYLT